MESFAAADVCAASHEPATGSEVVSLDGDDVGTLLHRFRPYLLAIARTELPRNLAASDLVQDTLIRGVDGFAGFRGTTNGELARWLRQILQNQAAAVRRHQGRQKREDPVDRVQWVSRRSESATPSEVAMSLEDRQRLEWALGRLAEDQRQAIHLRHRDDLSFREIGQRLDRSEEAARKLWARAVVQLQQELGTNERRNADPPG
jgi:RNA polymerase sigma-70 factor (ECF subfamily)